MARSTKQQTASAPVARPSARGSQPTKTAKPGANGAARLQKGARRHDSAPGLGSPIFEELVAELGDPLS